MAPKAVVPYLPIPGVYNLFAIAARITFIFMNYGRQ